MRVAALRIGGEPERWRKLGFAVEDGSVKLGGVRVEFLPPGDVEGIVSWSLEGAEVPRSIDGLVSDHGFRDGEPAADHPNGALSIDHIVVLTPSLERTTDAFAAIGVECRRVRDAGAGVRQGFFFVDDVLVEVVDGTEPDAHAPARFWGLTLVVADIDETARLLGDDIGRVKDAVQPGRRIATVRPEASGGLPLAFITQRGRAAG
jgi:hypothetical protein